jgi:NADPH2:quinone reductase
MAASEMKAWRVEAHGHPREVMHLRDVPVPEPGPGQVAIKASAVALNLPDTRLCFGTYAMKPQLPFTPGFDVAGRIIAVGVGVDPTLVGTLAIGVAGPPDGALAEVALVRAGGLYELPDDIPAGDAAALLIPFTTGQLALHRRGRLRPGETLLVHAGAGGVGSAAIQLGVLAGARVLATAGGPEKVALCGELGAEQAYDYRALDSKQLITAVREATGGRGADVIYDSVGGDVFHASRKMIASEGRLLVVGFASGDVAQAPTNQTLMANYDIVGVYFGAYNGPSSAAWRRDIWAQILDHYRAGRLRPLRDRTMTALDDDVAGAVADLGERRTTGRVVLELERSNSWDRRAVPRS